MAPDLVVPVREGRVNEQLRYALRSWSAHLPHGRVWLVGYRPAWVGGVEHIATRQAGSTKYRNTTAAVRAACEHPDVSDDFLLVNDDMFIMRPVDGMPVLHRGRVRDVEAYYAARHPNGAYLAGMRETRELLATLGHPEPLSYELHVPLPVQRTQMLAALDAGRNIDVVHKRTLYGNLAQIGGTQINDVKILHRAPRGYEGLPFLSTMPDSFTNGFVGQHVRAAFPTPCRYETGRP